MHQQKRWMPAFGIWVFVLCELSVFSSLSFVQFCCYCFLQLFGFAVLDCLDSLVTEVSLVCWREALRLLGSYARDKDTYYRLARK